MEAVEQHIDCSVSQVLETSLRRQRESYQRDPAPGLAERRNDLKKLKAMVLDHRETLIEAIDKDYGSRARQESLFTEIIYVVDACNHAIKNLKKWTKPQRRHTDKLLYPGASNRVIPQPLGCVGIIVPWNFPCGLSFGPLISAFAAGNRAMVKMSENSRHLTRKLIEISPDYFPEEKLVFFEETGSVGIEFSKLPFDLMLFTGSVETGKKVMRAAADNLTPVILELGGKSPAVIDESYPLDNAIDRIFYVKQFNAGQICINVDYVFVHKSQRNAFIDQAQQWVAQHVPDINSRDYTAIIDEKSFKRLTRTLKDAQDKGATVINLCPNQSPNPATRKFPLYLVFDSTPDMIIRQREIFGPILLVVDYDEEDEVVKHVNSYERPLAFYPFSYNRKTIEYYLDNIMSGGVTVNDALLHVVQHDLPFGGVGNSGIGHYHGVEGFQAFSKLRPVFHQARFSFMQYLRPPYGDFVNRVYDYLLWFKAR